MLYHHLFAFPDRIAGDYISICSFNGVPISYFIGTFGKLCKELIYAPKYSVLIFLWLLVMCYFTGIIIDYLWTLKSRLKIKNMIYFS